MTTKAETVKRLEAQEEILDQPAAPDTAAEREKTRELLDAANLDWAEAHTHAQKAAKAAGIDPAKVDGDSYGVPGIEELVDMIVAHEAVGRDALKARVEALEREHHDETCARIDMHNERLKELGETRAWLATAEAQVGLLEVASVSKVAELESVAASLRTSNRELVGTLEMLELRSGDWSFDCGCAWGEACSVCGPTQDALSAARAAIAKAQGGGQ